ncbi:putative 4-diphosphocytidyl-2-C-methyl-D-erythritol kinase [subsurface metagenome]
MGKALTLKVPAKVNIHLEVLGKRPDGYHEIVSIFQMVSLYDVLQISSLKYENAFHLEGDFNIKESENLITKTVHLFRKRTGLAGGIQIKVRKCIPPGAGLGGGSSNAAATLKGLNLLLAAELSPIRLKSLAAELGSDIPFFLTWPAAPVIFSTAGIISPERFIKVRGFTRYSSEPLNMPFAIR